eukprot:740303-Pyramimonas_sp.AAC.1
MIFHLICCASRWHNDQDIASKRDSTLLAAIDQSWVQLFGAMETVIVDSEGGMAGTFSEGNAEARSAGRFSSASSERSLRRATRC